MMHCFVCGRQLGTADYPFCNEDCEETFIARESERAGLECPSCEGVGLVGDGDDACPECCGEAYESTEAEQRFVKVQEAGTGKVIHVLAVPPPATHIFLGLQVTGKDLYYKGYRLKGVTVTTTSTAGREA